MTDHNNAEYAGKVKGMKTFKQLHQERLLKAKVIPASELAKQKEEEARRAQEFTRASLDEEFYAKTERSVSPDCPTPIGQRVGVVTREPFEDLP